MAVAIAGLTGCKVIEPTTIVDLNGLAYKLPESSTPSGSNQLKQLAAIWQAAEAAAYPEDDRARILDSQAAKSADMTDTLTGDQIIKNRRLLKAGMSVIYNSCNDFFNTEAITQQSLGFTKNVTNTISSPLSGALGLIPGSGIAKPLVGFISAGITGGIDSASATFLFGSDNLDDVRTLTMNALAAHESGVLGAFEQGIRAKEAAPAAPAKKVPITVTTTASARPASRQTVNAPAAATQSSQQDKSSALPTMPDFEWAKIQLADHQALCSPGKILWLAKQAIKSGNICSYTTASSAGANGSSSSAPASSLPTRVGVEAIPSCKTAQDTTPGGVGQNQPNTGATAAK